MFLASALIRERHLQIYNTPQCLKPTNLTITYDDATIVVSYITYSWFGVLIGPLLVPKPLLAMQRLTNTGNGDGKKRSEWLSGIFSESDGPTLTKKESKALAIFLSPVIVSFATSKEVILVVFDLLPLIRLTPFHNCFGSMLLLLYSIRLLEMPRFLFY